MKFLFTQVFILSLICLSSFNDLSAQSSKQEHSVFLLGNLESLSAEAPELDAIQSVLEKEKGLFTVLVNGDFIDKNGFGTSADTKDIAKVERLLEWVKDRGSIVFIPGDKEWDNGGKKGLKKVNALQDFLDTKSTKASLLFPRSGCLGPEVIDVGDHLRIIAINSPWFLQKKRPEEEDTDCKLLNEHEFWDELNDELADSDNRNVIVAVHHTPLSYGKYAGYKLLKKHFAPPIIGSMIASFHQNVGGPNDLSNEHLKHFSKQLFSKTKQHPGLIITAAHEYDLQLLQKDGNYYINSGALAKSEKVARGKETIFRSGKTGFVKLIFQENGQVDFKSYDITERKNISETYEKTLYATPCEITPSHTPKNTLYNPCKEDQVYNESDIPDLPISGSAVAGKHYDVWFLQRWLLGENYRSTWTTPLHNVPYVNLDTMYGGLTPYAKGGAAQTTSLKFKSEDGQRFAFRSIDKNPTKRMEEDLAISIYGKLSKDRTSHQQPYGSIAVAALIDQLGLPSSDPQVYLLPDHPKLGPFREEFANTFGLLELKPKGTKKTDNAFRDATKVVSSFQMYRKLLDDNDHQLDIPNYVTARIFDMWIGDWDRHEGNWKWLAYKDKDAYTYRPFPKDRDKAFSVLNGIYGIRMLKPLYINKEDFANNYGNLKYLNFKSRNMDRWLTNTFTYEDWLAEAKRIQEVMSDEVIDAALATMPSEVHSLSAPRIRSVLQKRRDKLPKMIREYYKMLVRQIDLVGTNSREYFEITRLENGDVRAQIYDLKKNGNQGKQILDRTFKKSETKEIRIYGLGKKDVFKISGESKKSILVRIIGGDGEDKIEDSSKVNGLKKHTKIYDKRNKDLVSMSSETKKMQTNEIMTFESGALYNYGDAIFLPFSSYNRDDGVALGVSGSIKQHAFNKPDFARIFRIRGSVTTKKNYNFNIDAQFRHVIKQWDMVAGLSIASRDKSMVRFYGYGNEVMLNDSLRDAGYYTNFSNSQQAYIGLTNTFWQKSTFTARLKFDFRDIDATPDDRTAPSIYDLLPPNNGLGETTTFGPEFDFNLDFRDNAAFPTKGMQFTLGNYSFYNSDLKDLGGHSKTALSAFMTKGIKIPVTLALKAGLEYSYGEVPFYYQSFLGQQGNHRGFLKNRYGGDAVGFLNTDLRFHLGKLATPLVPIKYGIFGLYDIGRVWADGEDSDIWHYAWGGGIYLVPYAENFNLTLTFAKADGEDRLFSFRVGFFVR